MRTLGDALAFDVFECCTCHTGRLEARTRADSAQLVCSGCGAVFEVKNGIPRFVAADGYAQSFGFQWYTHSRAQLDSCSGVPISSNRLFGATGWPGNLEGERVLEAGSGAGRFTEVLVGTGAEVFSLDYSSAVDANAQNNGAARNLTLFQAEHSQLAVAAALFGSGVVHRRAAAHARSSACVRQPGRDGQARRSTGGGCVSSTGHRHDLVEVLAAPVHEAHAATAIVRPAQESRAAARTVHCDVASRGRGRCCAPFADPRVFAPRVARRGES